MKRIIILSVACIGILSGCSSPPPVYNYTAGSTMTVEGAMTIGQFKYLPAEVGGKIKENEIESFYPLLTAVIDKPIKEYFRAAVFNESRLVGIDVKDSKNVLTGEIITFSWHHDLTEGDFTLEVKYIISSADHKECYNKIHTTKKTAPNSFGGSTHNRTWNEVIKINIEKAFQDPQFVSCIRP
jgi:hypothetical protein